MSASPGNCLMSCCCSHSLIDGGVGVKRGTPPPVHAAPPRPSNARWPA